MCKCGHKNICKVKRRAGKYNEDVGGEKKVQSSRKEVNSPKSDELHSIKEEVLPTCQVKLTRCDGLILPGLSCEAVNADADESNIQRGSSSGEDMDKSESEGTNRDIRVVSSRKLPHKQALDGCVSTHVGAKQHICLFCSKSFDRIGHLHIHIRTHTGERPHQCHLCSKSFGERGSLKMHITTHTNERAYQCQLCSKSFKRPEHLRSHMRSHIGERPHQCPFCSKSFSTPQVLKNHIRNHTGELAHQCSKSFAQQGVLNSHMKTHTLK